MASKSLYLSSLIGADNKVALGATGTGIDDLADINLTVQPEQIALNVDAPGPGHATPWLWTWAQSTLPFSRLAITNSPQLSVPVYQQGTYQINNFANTLHADMTQTHSFKLKWIEGAGDANLIDWVTTTTATMSHPDINDGADTLVQRLSFTVPSIITLPTLTAPNVTYTVVNSETSSGYIFSGTAAGTNVDLGPFYRGGTYTININATGHPFYFTTDNGTGFEAGSFVGEWTDGVTGSRTESGTITFTVPAGAPDVLYYQCGNHASMRGTIKVKDLAVETNKNGNYIIYGQHSQDSHTQPMEIRPLPELASQMCIVYDQTLNQWMPQDLATYVENTPSFENKIKEVAGTATLVAPDGTSLVAGVEIYSDASYLPQIDNTRGDIAFANDTSALYIWDGSTWVTAVADGTASGSGGGGGGGSAASPTITSVTPASYNGTDEFSFAIAGTNFTLGTVVDFITSSGTVHRATTTTVTDQANITAITPQSFLESDGPLDVRITTNTGATVTTTDAIQTGGSPVWTTAAGTLYQNAFSADVADGSNSYRVNMPLNETIAATDPEGQPVTYSITSGTLPPNGVLNAHTGNISGDLPSDIGADTTYSFTASANDSSGNATQRTFNIIVKNQPGLVGWLWLGGGMHTHTLPPGDYMMLAIGAGGGGASGPGGAGAWVPTRISTTQATDLQVGVGMTASGSSYGNDASYVMRGGTGGGAGGGGGGSFVAVSNTSAVTDYHLAGSYNYIVAAGGGGGGANHSFTANYGGHGLGGGGAQYSTSWPNTSLGGNDGYNSDGNGGAAQSGGAVGGSASGADILIGGNGGSNTNGGGGGGGGAGGGGGGAGGSGSAAGGNGGYMTTTPATLLNARGGGGGGSHGSSCGGTGGGGGSLIFTSYRWDADAITYPGQGQDNNISSQGYYTKMNTYINNTANLASIWSQIVNLGSGGSNNGQNGAVLIMTVDADMSSMPPTVIN